MSQYQRTHLLWGKENVNSMQNHTVLVFGLGGVGGYAIEHLARFGIKHIKLVDHDEAHLTNLNRQVIALHSTLNQKKVDLFKQRIHDIDPSIQVDIYDQFYLPESDKSIFEGVDYVIDAIDTISAKIDIIDYCVAHHIPIISSMGMGSKIDPTKIQVADLAKTSVCPLAKVMRRELKKRGITHVLTVYSTEEAIKPSEFIQDEESQKVLFGSYSVVVSVAGALLANQVIHHFKEEISCKNT